MQPRMTSIHMNTSESQATTPTSTINGTASNQVPSITSKYDEANRMRQRMEDLKRHHAESAMIHQRTQPMIDEQTREDTQKFFKAGQVNGTKAKSQKPRAPKRQRTSTSSNNSANTSISTNINNNNVKNQSQIHAPTGAKSANNGLQHQQATMPQHHNMMPLHSQQSHIIQQQAPPRAQVVMSTGMQPIQQISSYSPHMQQSMHAQRQQHPNQMSPNHSYNDTYQNQYQPPPVYSQQRHQMPPQPSHNGQAMHTMSQNQNSNYMSHQGYAQQDHQSYYQPQPIMTNHYSTLPNDLDLNIDAGLECDIDSLIKHEVSIEGQLNFNPDLLDRLVDGYYYHH